MTIDDLLTQNPHLAEAVSILIDSAQANGDTQALTAWDLQRDLSKIDEASPSELDAMINAIPIHRG
jgi:hypothetical protein